MNKRNARGFAAKLTLVASLFYPTVASAAPGRAAQWTRDIAEIASDKNEGRLTGSTGYLRAASYVEQRFRELGLKPAGANGTFRQPVAFEEQKVDFAKSSAHVVVGDKSVPLVVGRDLIVSAGGAPLPAHLDAPLVFVGYGLHMPGRGHDDFAGLDLRGKVVVVISGGPASLSGPEKAAARSNRARFLADAGAVGLLSLTTPHQVEIPWTRLMLLASQPGMYLADGKLRETSQGYQSAALNPQLADQLFEGSGHGFAELRDLADRSAELPRFALKARLSTAISASHKPLVSPNLVAVLQGADPKLRSEFVVVSAHLDHLGVGEPIGGDRIYNGAMDDASGVASVLDIAGQLAAGPPLRRSVLFLVVTAEEKGLLGSHYFAAHPTVEPGAIIADLNFDMPLPLWKLTSVMAQGADESSLGKIARTVASAQGLRLVPDPLPDRNTFIRTDQFSFVKAGVPALAFKFGFEKDTPEFQIEHNWRANRYHSPSDDAQQPGVLDSEAVKLDDFVAAIARDVANGPQKPSWNPQSLFKPIAAR
ncbi:MAG TPA: M28 family metallopeptidase [Sphingomicrobium sp.]|nr:M28 family metallopeptidase [Sphingomicrobium sp.]